MCDSPIIVLSAEQRIALAALISKLQALPHDAMAPGGVMPTSHAACLIAMKHPGWLPLREQAAKLVEMLEPAIKRNQEFLNSLYENYSGPSRLPKTKARITPNTPVTAQAGSARAE